MSVYRELDLMVEYRGQFAFKGKTEDIAKVKMPNIAYPNQHIDIEIPHGSRNKLHQILSKLRLTLTLSQQTKHVAL